MQRNGQSSWSTAGQSGLSNLTSQRHDMSFELRGTARVPSSHWLDASVTKGDTWNKRKQIPSITHRTNMDTFERLSEADLKESAIVLVTFAYHAAMRDEKIPHSASN